MDASTLITTELEDLSGPDRQFIALYLDLHKIGPAAMQAYDEPDPVKAGRLGNALLKRRPEVFALLMDHLGLTDAHLIQKLKTGLHATKTKYATHQGKILDKRTVPDYATRAAYVRMGLDLHGHAPKQALTLEDDAGRRLGPVILPVREGLELPAAYELAPGANEGGDRQEAPGGDPIPGDVNASPVQEGDVSEKKSTDGDENYEGWGE